MEICKWKEPKSGKPHKKSLSYKATTNSVWLVVLLNNLKTLWFFSIILQIRDTTRKAKIWGIVCIVKRLMQAKSSKVGKHKSCIFTAFTLTTTQGQPTTFLAFPSKSILQSCVQPINIEINTYAYLWIKYTIHRSSQPCLPSRQFTNS